MTYKRRYKNQDFKPLKMTILGDNPKKTANISQIEAVTAIPNDLNQLCPFLVKITRIEGFHYWGRYLIIKENPIKPKNN